MIDKKLEEMIYEVRGQYVMLDSDLALLYGYQDGTKSINRAIKRHLELFNEEMYYQLTKEESDIIWCQIGTKKTIIETRGGKYNTPHVLTQEGIKILSGILRKQNVPEVTNDIIKAFENMKQEIASSSSIALSKEKNIRNLIHIIRGEQVMLDYDLAKIYKCSNGTKTINLAVKRHPNKFPNDFYFQLNEEEFFKLRFQIETAIGNNMSRNLPYAFTEQGVYMLASILRTSVADSITVQIMRAFVAMKVYINDNLIEQSFINNLVFKHDERIQVLEEGFKKFDEKKEYNGLFFAGQIYDAYSKLVDIMSEAEEELIIVDGYADKKVLDIISKLGVPVILFIKTEGNLSDLVINTYNEQYGNLTVIRTNAIHDRFIILDRKVFYHCGASINHAGRGAFAINVIEDELIKKSCLEWLISMIEKEIISK